MPDPTIILSIDVVPSAPAPLGIGRTVAFTLNLSASVTVGTSGGAPRLRLSNGATAQYDPDASGPASLVFNLTVAAGQDTTDLTVTGLELSGATIRDTANRALDTTGLTSLPSTHTGLVIQTIAPPSPVGTADFYFIGNDPAGRTALFRTDGTASGTRILSPTAASLIALNPASPVPLGSRLLFTGMDALNRSQLWVTDGTTATSLSTIANAAPTGLAATDLAPFGTHVLFQGTDAQGQRDLWITDGTAAGTRPLLVSGAASSGLAPTAFTPLGSRMLFLGQTAAGAQTLWITDGTAAGTTPITPAGAAPDGLLPSNLTPFGNRVLFRGIDANNQPGLWITDGTSAGTAPVPVQGLAYSLDPQALTVLGSVVLFRGTNDSGQTGLWTTDGTAANTSALVIPGAAAIGLFPTNLTVAGGKVFFVGATDTDGPALWTSDGTVAGTARLVIPGLSVFGLQLDGLTAWGSRVVFSAVNANEQTGLWISDGTSAGTHEIADIANASTLGINPVGMTLRGDRMVFQGLDAANARNLWITDGTAAGTQEVAVADGNPFDLAPAGFTQVTPDAGMELVPAADGSAGDGGATNLHLTNAATPTLIGLAASGTTITVTDRAGGTASVLGTALTDQTGRWTFVTPQLTEGTHSLTATATDLAGNVSAPSLPFILTIDRTPPAAPSLALADGTDTLGSLGTPTPALAGSAEPGSIVTIRDLAGTTPLTLGTATAGADGTWAFVTPTLSNGAHALTATATDAAGNTSSATTPLDVQVGDGGGVDLRGSTDPLFDATWYHAHYPTVQGDLLRYYMTSGWKLGQDPSA